MRLLKRGDIIKRSPFSRPFLVVLWSWVAPIGPRPVFWVSIIETNLNDPWWKLSSQKTMTDQITNLPTDQPKDGQGNYTPKNRCYILINSFWSHRWADGSLQVSLVLGSWISCNGSLGLPAAKLEGLVHSVAAHAGIRATTWEKSECFILR